MANDTPSDKWTTLGILRLVLQFAAVLAVAWGLHLFLDWSMHLTGEMKQGEMIRVSMVIILLLAYALFIAIPFVPGIEIGLSLLAIEGARIAPFVYLATVSGLYLAYLAGRHLSYRWLAARLRQLSLRRAADLLEEVAPLSQKKRLARLRARLPRWAAGLAVRYRYLGLALLINLPGSALIGGGGGICLVAGLSRVFAPRPVLLTLALAVAPVPLLVWWFGWSWPA